VIGIVGGGQLGRMLALAAAELGFEVAILEPDRFSRRPRRRPDHGPYDDPAGLKAPGRGRRRGHLRVRERARRRRPGAAGLGARRRAGPRALAVAQDRVEEKSFLNAHGAPTVDFRPADTAEQAIEAAHARRAGAAEDPARGL
jgi:5-(carboxyamino)imidazole ribonucleotide synthase